MDQQDPFADCEETSPPVLQPGNGCLCKIQYHNFHWDSFLHDKLRSNIHLSYIDHSHSNHLGNFRTHKLHSDTAHLGKPRLHIVHSDNSTSLHDNRLSNFRSDNLGYTQPGDIQNWLIRHSFPSDEHRTIVEASADPTNHDLEHYCNFRRSEDRRQTL